MVLCHKLLWCQVQILTLQKPHIPASFSRYLVINKCVTVVKVSNFSGHYLCNRSTLDIGYIGIVQHKEHSPEFLSIPPGTPCIIEYINRIIKVIDYKNARWKPEINSGQSFPKYAHNNFNENPSGDSRVFPRRRTDMNLIVTFRTLAKAPNKCSLPGRQNCVTNRHASTRRLIRATRQERATLLVLNLAPDSRKAFRSSRSECGLSSVVPGRN